MSKFNNEYQLFIDRILIKDKKLAWDSLSNHKIKLIKTFCFEKTSYKYCSKKTKLNSNALAKYSIYYSLNRLSRFTIVRDKLASKEVKLTKRQEQVMKLLYIKKLTGRNVAKKLDITQQRVNQIVKNIFKKYKITIPIWTTTYFTKKHYFVDLKALVRAKLDK